MEHGAASAQYLYSINLDSAEVQNYGLINDAPTAKYNWSYGASLWSEVKMEGIYHDKLYLYYRYVKDPQIIIDYLNTDWVENGSPRNDIPWIIENKCLDLKTGEITQDVREENLRIFKESLDMVTNLNNWHAFMGLFADAEYVNGSIVASTNAVVFCYVLYLIGKYDYKVQPIALQKVIKKWIFMSTITYFYTGSTESEVEKQFADLRNVHTADEFISYLDGVISTRFSDDYFNLTLPSDLMSAAATSPAWFGYIAALNVLGTPMLFSTTTLAAKPAVIRRLLISTISSLRTI